MFAGAAREAVFSRPEVIARLGNDFIPVALKAGLVNRPPAGDEGRLYAEIARSRPAPQGICVINSEGKVLDWVLMFDEPESIGRFLDHAAERYAEFPDASRPVPAERFMRFPSHPLPDVPDTTGRIAFAPQHSAPCPAEPTVPPGTLTGRVVGRALDEEGTPMPDTTRQEHYLEARFTIPAGAQRELLRVVQAAGESPFELPDSWVRALVEPAYLGQLDVNPMGSQPGGQAHHHDWEFEAEPARRLDDGSYDIEFRGVSTVSGGASRFGTATDGRQWSHQVTLTWRGSITVDAAQDRITSVTALADGFERLRWGVRGRFGAEPDVAHLPAGRAIDLDGPVRYGLLAPISE